MSISANAAFITVSMKIWTGRATLPTGTQTAVDGVVIPEEIKRDGNIAICNPAILRPFAGLKSRLVRLMQTYTLKFMGGYALDMNKLDELTGKLEALRDKFNETVQDFAVAYPVEAQAWADAHAECAGLITSKQPEPGKIADRFHFRWSVYRLDPVGENAEAELETMCDEAITSLASDIARVYQNTFVKSKSFNYTQPLVSLARRCDVLAFTTPYIGTVGEVLKALLKAPKREVCAAVLSMLGEPAQLQSFCDAVKENGSCDAFALVGIVNSMGPGVTPAVAEPEPVSESAAPQPVSVDDMCAFLDSGGLY